MIAFENIKPKKRFGQHFLVDQSVLARIARACQANKHDTIVEIGSGKGQLTTVLAPLADRIIAVEKDRDLIPQLRHACLTCKNVEIIEQDVLRFDPTEYGIGQGSYILAGNIPYYLTGMIMELVLEQWPAPTRIIFTVQKEVAQRIVAKPGNLSILGVLTQTLASARMIATIPAGAFWPAPKVQSAILELVPRPLLEKNAFEMMKQAVKAGFSHPRKLCASNLARQYGMTRSEMEKLLMRSSIEPSLRAQDISVEQWIKISTLLKPLSA